MMVCLILTHNVIRIYHKVLLTSAFILWPTSTRDFGIREKSDAVCGFLAYFCAVLLFSDPPYAPLSNKFRSSCVICLVIAREIFLLQSDCSAITKVYNFLLLNLLYN